MLTGGARLATDRIRALGVVASSSRGSRTKALVEGILAGATRDGSAQSSILLLADSPLEFADGTRAEDREGATAAVLDAVDAADVVVFGAPMYRATAPGSMKNLFDLLPRGGFDGNSQALRAKAVAVAATGASDHHYLGIDSMTEILRGFFAAWVVPPGIYASHKEIAEGRLSEPLRAQAEATGRALVDLHRAIAASPAMQAVEPQV
jgi:FMN reductase